MKRHPRVLFVVSQSEATLRKVAVRSYIDLVAALFLGVRFLHADRNREQGQRDQANGAYADKKAHGKYDLYHRFAPTIKPQETS